MAFTVPDTSPPSTPDKSRSLFSNPSTTPAGPPPSSTASFGRGNSSTYQPSPSRSNFSFGESKFGESKFGQSDNFGGNDSLFSSLSSSKLPPLQNSLFSGSFANQLGGFKPVNAGNKLKVRNRKPHNLSQMSAATEDWEDDDGEEEEEEVDEEEFEEEYEDEEEEEGEEEYEEEEEEEEEEYEDDMETEATNNTFSGSQFGLSNMSFGQSNQKSAVPQKRIYSNPGNAKRAKIDEQWATSSPVTAKTKPTLPKKPSQFPAIARDMAARTRAAAVTETGDVVLPTDEFVGELLDKLQAPGDGAPTAAALFSQAVTSLTDLWTMASINERQRAGEYRPHNRFGPGENASGIEQATAVASLLLQLHHPPSKHAAPRRLLAESVFTNNQSLVPSASSVQTFDSIPKVLITWLNENHLGSAQEVDALKQMSPNATASPDFWGIVQAGVLRGRFGDMASLLRSADFNYARSALQDGIPQAGYRGAQLQSIQKVVNKAIQLLELSPLNQEDDWDVIGSGWTAYRKRVRSALLELQEFAEGEEEPQAPPAPRFEASNFGVSGNFGATQNGISFTQSSRMAESRVPWSIYQGIKTIYGTILGETSAITSVAQDWFEATVGLTAWWGAEDESEISDEHLQELYLERLSSSFAIVADSENARYRPNSFDRLHIGVVCVFEGDVKGALRLLETWSLCVATAVAEIAHEAGWFESGRESLPGFSEDDLMVLSYGQDGGPAVDDLTKDDILDSYAYGLGNRDKFQHNKSTRKGWQLALEMLSRIEDTRRTKERVSELLDVIPVDTIEQVEQVIIMCGDLGFEEEGRKIAANFGEQIMAEAGTKKDCDYGLAMVCFARARSIRKLKEIANNLIGYSLQQSRAWPPDEQLGGQLRSLVKNPRVCLGSIANVDEEAARILQFYASGYATLRRFYDLRDEQAQSQMRPLARKRAAAEALVAVIRSSADSIYGGLYDPERDSAVLVDNLLSLLGEVLVFVNDSPSSILSVEQQSIILAAIEDLETVAPRVFAAVQEFFYECLNEYIFEKTGEARKGSGLQKSASALTSSSTFSMVGSEMMVDSVPNGSANDKDTWTSGALVPRPDTAREYARSIQRGWDWRAGLAESGSDEVDEIKPENKVLRILRLRLAKGMVWR